MGKRFLYAELYHRHFFMVGKAFWERVANLESFVCIIVDILLTFIEPIKRNASIFLRLDSSIH
jgi:hypothetical protein